MSVCVSVRAFVCSFQSDRGENDSLKLWKVGHLNNKEMCVIYFYKDWEMMFKDAQIPIDCSG